MAFYFANKYLDLDEVENKCPGLHLLVAKYIFWPPDSKEALKEKKNNLPAR